MSRSLLHVAEPPSQFLLRPPLVVDCSLLAGSLFNETWQEEADRQLAGRDLHAPFLLQVEVASAALKKTRQGFAELAAEGLQRLGEIAIQLHRIDEPPVVAIAQRYGLSAYDSAYLWLAAELKCPLATFDEKLGAAARIHLATLA